MNIDDQNGLQDNLLGELRQDIASGDALALRKCLSELHPAEISQLIESVPASEREIIWQQLPEEIAGDVLAELGEVARTTLTQELTTEAVVAAVETLEIPELAEVIDELPEDLGDLILESLSREDRELVIEALAYPDEAIARLVNPDVVAVRADVTLEVVQRYLRRRQSLPDNTDGLMVIDREGVYLGKLSYSSLLTNEPSRLVHEVMQAGADKVGMETPKEQVAALFERRDLVAVAVVDDAGRLVGMVTVDDVLDLVLKQADQRLLNMAGLNEDEDLFASVLPSSRRRAVWLGVNLLTAFLAAWVIGLFEETLEKIVALAVLMPVVASMGGIAGSQTLTLAIRGLALGQIGRANVHWLISKELGVGLLNGLLWALVVGLVAYVWFQEIGIGLVIAAAITLNLLVAALCGVAIPLLLDKLGMDPALSGAVILTTVTDVVGFLSFLGLATLYLL